jgi:hypothetical protein
MYVIFNPADADEVAAGRTDLLCSTHARLTRCPAARCFSPEICAFRLVNTFPIYAREPQWRAVLLFMFSTPNRCFSWCDFLRTSPLEFFFLRNTKYNNLSNLQSFFLRSFFMRYRWKIKYFVKYVNNLFCIVFLFYLITGQNL